MTCVDFCRLYHVSIWSAQRAANSPRWRIVIEWHDGSRHQLTLTVRAQERPSAPEIMRHMIRDARASEAAPTLPEWTAAGHPAERYAQVDKERRRLLRFLGPELYSEALSCTD